MARTRNLDPGRDHALHYAFTRWRRHAKRLVYAYWLLVGLDAICPGAGFAARLAYAQPSDQAAVPCAACQVLSVTPGQVTDLPARLDGVRIVVRVQPGAADWRAIDALRARGA